MTAEAYSLKCSIIEVTVFKFQFARFSVNVFIKAVVKAKSKVNFRIAQTNPLEVIPFNYFNLARFVLGIIRL